MNALCKLSSIRSFASIPRLKQIARMLAIECSDNLAGVEAREADDRHFREPEFRVHA